jgi:hypothetical protein
MYEPKYHFSRTLAIAGVFLLADIALGVLYAVIPSELTAPRFLLAMVQLGSMVLTMAAAAVWVLEDF